MPKYNVIQEFIDSRSRRRKIPGDSIEAEGKRAEELKIAGVIGSKIEETPKKAVKQEKDTKREKKSK